MKNVWLLVAVLIFGVSCYGLFGRAPASPVPDGLGVDKVVHFLMFFGQFYVLGRALKPSRLGLLGLWCVALGWALTSELIQGHFTARTMDIWDAVADTLGATLAVALLWTRKHSTTISRA